MPAEGQRDRAVVQAYQTATAAKRKRGAPASQTQRRRRAITLITKALKGRETKHAIRDIAKEGLTREDVAAWLAGGIALVDEEHSGGKIDAGERLRLRLLYIKEMRLLVADARAQGVFNTSAVVQITLGSPLDQPQYIDGPGDILEIVS